MADARSRRERHHVDIAGDPHDPEGLPATIHAFVESMEYRNYSVSTINLRVAHLAEVAGWLHERGIGRPSDVSRAMLERFQRWLFEYRTKDGQPRAVRTQATILESVCTFFRWLHAHEHIPVDPAANLERPRVPKTLPKDVLSHREVELVLAGPGIHTPVGLRDRAILETFYATGIRRAELATLQTTDVDFDRSTVFVRQGKGAKDRVVPIGNRALTWLDKYLLDSRPWFSLHPDNGYLFLTVKGEPLGYSGLGRIVSHAIRDAALGKGGSCHALRHSMATALLDGGANLRVIQEILGHVDLSSTQIYTRVSIREIQDAYNKAHPAAEAAPQTIRVA